MTTSHQRSARDRAADHIQNVRDTWPTTCPAVWLVDAIPTDLLQELHDERLMAVKQ